LKYYLIYIFFLLFFFSDFQRWILWNRPRVYKFIGARSDPNDEHVAGRVLYIVNLYTYIYGIFLSPRGRRAAVENFFRQNGHELDFRGDRNEYRPKNRSNDNPYSGTIFTYLLYFIIIICNLVFVSILRASTLIHYNIQSYARIGSVRVVLNSKLVLYYYWFLYCYVFTRRIFTLGKGTWLGVKMSSTQQIWGLNIYFLSHLTKFGFYLDVYWIIISVKVGKSHRRIKITVIYCAN